MPDSDPVQKEIDSAIQLGRQLEELVVRAGEFPGDDRNILLMGYWALLFDYHKGILNLLSDGSYGSAFALVRPLVEALVRAHLALSGSDEVLNAIREDKYRVDFATIGPQIDAAFRLGGLMENLMKSREALHSYTHSGVFQLSRRYDGQDLKPRYKSDAILEVIRVSTSAVFMVTSLVTKHLKRDDAWSAANDMYAQWGNH